MKAFIVNRVGDFGYLLGIFGVFVLFDSVEFSTIFEMAPQMADATFNFLGMDVHALTACCLLLSWARWQIGAVPAAHLAAGRDGRPDTGSALIHAATMVTAGVFLVARMSPLYEFAPNALAFVTFIGGTTAILRRNRRPGAE